LKINGAHLLCDLKLTECGEAFAVGRAHFVCQLSLSVGYLGFSRLKLNPRKVNSPLPLASQFKGKSESDARLAFAKRVCKASGCLLEINRGIWPKPRLTQSSPPALYVKSYG
jgi:hypothetical protein